ncbi:MAG: hypothetical protein PHG89_10995 [Gallionella sp.]|nr:hypothetical protein [Gallionella sp.]
MKTLQGNFISVFLAIICGMVLLTNTSRAEDESLPPEVKKLIGMKTSPEENPGRIPGWINLWGSSVLWGSGIGNDMYFTVLKQKETTVLAIKAINRKERTTSVLDARVIPGKLLRFYWEDGKLKWKKNEKALYRITQECSHEGSSNREIILGMWKFEPNSKCTDPSTLVKKAWLLNPENGRLTDIPTQGVSCREPDCGDE